MTDQTCTTWKKIFTENKVVQLTKDYRFCRGHGAKDVCIDEGGGVKPVARWFNDILASSFKSMGVFSVASMRIRGETLEEKIIIAYDKPGAENIVVSMRTESIHLTKLRRIST